MFYLLLLLTFADFTVLAFFMPFPPPTPICSCSSAVGLKIRKLGLSVRVLVQLLLQRPRWSAVQGSSPPGQHETQALNVLLTVQSYGAVRVGIIRAAPHLHPYVHSLVCTRGNEEWKACSIFLRMWPRSKIYHFHSHPIG